MKALRIREWKTPPEFDDVPVPEPGPGEVLVKIAAAGLCSSDLHLVHDWHPDAYPQVVGWKMPWTLGHENGGWVEGGDSAFKKGTPVVVNSSWHCGNCRNCRKGATNYCETIVPAGKSGGFGVDGGMAEYMVAPASCIVPLKSMDPADAAPLTDAGLTSYHAVKQVMPLLQPGSTVVVIGVGGLGHLAVEFLHQLTGAQIIAVDTSKAALELAEDRGADICLSSDETTLERIKEATDGFGADAVLEMVGINPTLELAVRCLRRMGRVVVVGISSGAYPFNYTSIVAGGSMMTTLGGSMAELAEVIALAEAGRLKPHATKFKLDEAPEVFQKLHDGKIAGRAVLVP